MSAPLRIGSRGSRLALWQANWVRDRLAEAKTAAEIVIIKTAGDVEQERPLHTLEGKGFFTKEIEDALLDRRIDVAVHSLKDLPTALPPGLALAAVPRRADAAEALVAREQGIASVLELPKGARVGTSSLRRVAQVRHLRPDLEVLPLRGNVPTRVNKVTSGSGPDAALLALAGLSRLGIADGAAVRLDPFEVMPAPAQGALGLEIRADDSAARNALRPLEDGGSAAAVAAERALLAALGGGCQAPVAAYTETTVEEGREKTRLYGRVVSGDGSLALTASTPLDPADPAAAGRAVARLLSEQGALKLLAR